MSQSPRPRDKPDRERGITDSSWETKADSIILGSDTVLAESGGTEETELRKCIDDDVSLPDGESNVRIERPGFYTKEGTISLDQGRGAGRPYKTDM